MSNKLFQQDLKKPDEFESVFGRWMKFVLQNGKTVSILLGLLVVGGGLFAGRIFYQNKLDRKAADDFKKMTDSLVGTENTKSNDQKIKEMDEFLTKHPGSRISSSVLLIKGKTLLSSKKFTDAEQVYRSAKTQLAHPYDLLADEGIANSLMEQKKWGEAEGIWKTLSSNKDNPLRDEHFWKLGMTQEAAGKKIDAIQTYKNFETEFQNSPLLEKVRARLAALQA